MLFNNTMSVPEFKTANGIKSITPWYTKDGKPYFKADNGIEGRVSPEADASIKANGLADVRVSWCTETSKDDFFMIHLRSSQDGHTKGVS